MTPLEKIAFFLEQIYRHESYQSNCLESLCTGMGRLLELFGEPDGTVTFHGSADVDKRELQKAFRDRRLVEAESVRMDFQFKQQLFLGLGHDEKIKEILDESQLHYLRNTLSDYQKLNDLMLVVEEKVKESIESATRATENMQVDMTTLLETQIGECKRRYDKEFDKARLMQGQLEEGLRKLDSSVKKVQAMQAQAENTVNASKPAKRSIKMRGPTKG